MICIIVSCCRNRQLSQPYYQGYYECHINDNLLKEDTIRIEKIKAVLPSGLSVDYPGNCIVQDKCLINLRGTDTEYVNLWLVLKRFNSGYKNVSSVNDKRGSARWVSPNDESNMRNVYHDSRM
ncbi:type VI secretion system baseplate subunit TssK [Escherichia coli]